MVHTMCLCVVVLKPLFLCEDILFLPFSSPSYTSLCYKKLALFFFFFPVVFIGHLLLLMKIWIIEIMQTIYFTCKTLPFHRLKNFSQERHYLSCDQDLFASHCFVFDFVFFPSVLCLSSLTILFHN